MEEVSAILERRYPGMKEFLEPILCSFIKSGCADDNILVELRSGHKGQLLSRVWESILYKRFSDQAWSVEKLNNGGPDFLLNVENYSVYVEATVPAPEGLPAKWLNSSICGVKSMPHKEMLLRWTNSLSTKSRKHLDDIKKSHINAKYPFVIAINSCRLSQLPEENGISQWPFAVESVFPIGPLAIPINRETGIAGEMYQSLRFNIHKEKTNQDIPTDNFLNPEYKHVSALIGCSTCFADEETREKFHGFPPMFLVHNPLATNPLPEGWLPGAIEYSAKETAKDEYTLSRIDEAD